MTEAEKQILANQTAIMAALVKLSDDDEIIRPLRGGIEKTIEKLLDEAREDIANDREDRN